MKNILIICSFLLLGHVALAQLDRTKAPAPGPAKKIEIGKYEQITLKNGLKVFVVEDHKLPTLSFTLSFDVGLIREKDHAGYTSMVGQILRAGTTTKTKEELDEAIDFMGASVSAGSSFISGSSLSKYKEEVLALMTDILYNPSFPGSELEKVKKQTLSSLATQKDDPDAISGNVVSVLNYGKSHPYGELTTEKTVENITMDDIKRHYQTYFKPNIAYLVIVGDITKKEAQKLVKKYFNDWEQGEVKKENFEAPVVPEKNIVALVDRPSSVQSVINITYPLENKPGSPDNMPVAVMNEILGVGFSARINQNLREDKGYTYGASARVGTNRYVASFAAGASVRNEVTDSAIHEFMYELKRIVLEEVTEKEMKQAKSSMAGRFARSLESPGTVARFALNTQLNNLPGNHYADYLKRLESVTIADVKRVAQKYIKPENVHIVVVGKAEEIAEKIKPFGELKYYDVDGNEYDPEAAKAAVADISATDIINKYIDAIGGRERLEKIEDISRIVRAKVQGQDLTIEMKSKGNNMSSTVVKFGPMEVQKSIFNNGKARVTVQGQTQEVPEGPQLEALKRESILFPELYFEQMGAKLEVMGVEKVGSKDTYKVSVTINGSTSLNYFDVESGLKLKEESQGQGLEVSEFQEVNGVTFAKTVKLINPQMGALDATVEVEVNTNFTPDLFKLD